MSVISYAQNCEDIMLLRAFADVSNGFYIDVGAQDPTVDSVTRLFYERGWRGINIDPVLHWHAKLQKQRQRDVNLCVAAGDHRGQISLFEVVGTGLSTTVGDIAERHSAEGRQVIERSVALTTLDEICTDQEIDQVHFLKIDVEGAEASVLRGISLDRIRPWLILVEATVPNTQISTHEDWESLLTDRGYQFVYADGLNRFYLADERKHLRPAFALPPNYFDDFITHREQAGRDELKGLHAYNARVQGVLDRVEGERKALAVELHSSAAQMARLQSDMTLLLETAQQRQHRITELEGQCANAVVELEAARHAVRERDALIQLILNSLSWRLTKPLRFARRLTVGLLRRGLIQPLRVLGRNLLKTAWIHRMANRLLRAHPALRTRVATFLFGQLQPVVGEAKAGPESDASSHSGDDMLSARERDVLAVFEREGRNNDSAEEKK